MTPDPNNEARDLLKRLVEVVPQCASCIHVEDSPAYTAARDYLKRTEPVHPAKKAFEEWKNDPMNRSGHLDRAYLAAYRKGMEDSAEILMREHKHDHSIINSILNAAKEVPVD